MSTLQDQLKKAGLVKPKSGPPRKKKKAPKVAKKERAKVSDETLRAQQAMIKKAKRDRALNAQREAERQQREIDAQVMQLIDHAKLERPEDQSTFNFTFKKKVKSIAVSEDQRVQLTRGLLAVVMTPGARFEVVPKSAALKLSERRQTAVVFLAQPNDEGIEAADDPYAGYEVPDDLMW